MATYGAWLEAVDPAVADSVLARARTLPGPPPGAVDRAELTWMDGVIGVVRGDEGRVRAAIAALPTDTLVFGPYLRGSLSALWLNRTNPDAAADSLKVLSDRTMRNGGFSIVAAALDRFLVARALRRRGAAAEAERYLMWVDAALNTARTISVTFISPLVAYERAQAFDEAGDRAQALYHLRQFVEVYKQPPPAHRPMVEAAGRRLKELEATDVAPPARRVP